MKQVPLGPLLVAIGVFGGGLLWIFLIGLRFDYIITVVYGGSDPGESIWALDPLFTILAATPGIALTLIGLILSIPSALGERNLTLNLFYLGEICLLVTTITSTVGYLGLSGLIVEAVMPSTVVIGLIALTGIIHIISFAFSKSITKVNPIDISKYTAIFLSVEIVTLTLVVVLLHLYTWSFIRSISLVILSSGILGLLLLIPRFLNKE